MTARWLTPLGAIVIWLACSAHACHFARESAGNGMVPEDACPPDGTDLTWENFGRPFFDDHCQRCHGAGVEARNGAPPQITFDTHEQVQMWADRIYARAAYPHTSMPPGPDDVQHAERHMLAEWLGCGAP